MSKPALIACASCGALNEPTFGRCVRCQGALAASSTETRAPRRVPAARRPQRGDANPVHPQLAGRFGAESFPVTKAILVFTALVFAAQLLQDFRADPSFGALLRGSGQGALRVGAAPYAVPWLMAEPWRLLSANFVHYGAIHFGFNMYFFSRLGAQIERSVGPHRLAAAYLLSGVFGFAASLAWWWFAASPDPGIISVPVRSTAGASASVFGMLGLVLGKFLGERDPRWKQWLVQGVGYTLIGTLILGAYINHAAHLGGLVAGVGIGWLYGRNASVRNFERVLGWFCLLSTVVAVCLSPFSATYQAYLAELAKLVR